MRIDWYEREIITDLFIMAKTINLGAFFPLVLSCIKCII